MRSTMVTLVVAVLVGSAVPAFAGGGEKGDWELGIYGGMGILDDYAGASPEDDFLFGGRVGYFLSRHWSFEFSAQKLPTETKETNADVEIEALRLNGIYNFSPGAKLRPFLTLGVGNERTDVEGFPDNSDFGWNAGGGVRWFLNPMWAIRADGRYVSVDVGDPVDEMQNNLEVALGLSLHLGGGGGETAVVAPNQAPTVTLVSDRSEILPGETARLTATSTDPEGDAVTYTWSSTAGRVTGSGANATLDFTGVTPPSTTTVTVRGTDTHGNVGTATADVRLMEPARPAESVSCLAGGFPRNLSRLTNVDKACLDDVVQRLRTDPRAHVVVIGHADSRETSANTIAQQRATAVKDYMVAAGVEASRITTRSKGSTMALDTGTDATAQGRNRRVEVWFVPEGARDPE